MLQRLYIKNYAIIDELEISFEKGLHVITGETGAGKSIVMDALQLILGQRADSSALVPDKKCVVEGVFSGPPPPGVENLAATLDLDNSDEWVLRREVAPGGKSRSFVNDTPVSLAQLKSLAALWVDLHQQFDTMELQEEDFQKKVLDSLAGNNPLLEPFAKTFNAYDIAVKKLDKLKNEQEQASRELDYNRFLLEELTALSLKENELEQLEADAKLLENAEGVRQTLTWVHDVLLESNDAVIIKLKNLENKLLDVGKMLPAAQDLQTRLHSCLIELKDIDAEVEHLGATVTFDPERLQMVNERLSEAYRLLKKHAFTHGSQLIEFRNKLEEKIQQVQERSGDIADLEREISILKEQSLTQAKKISEKRKRQVKPFVQKVNALLLRVGMPHAGIEVSVTEKELDKTGIDVVEFLFQANMSTKGGFSNFQPLGKVASGGELSRLMLCIKSLMAGSLRMPTLIFDEIDTGISGEAALQVAQIVKELSAYHQLIVITHQPQIAARSDIHFFIYKEMREGRIISRIRKLDNEGRIQAIARMLGGEKPTAATLANAREMVEAS